MEQMIEYSKKNKVETMRIFKNGVDITDRFIIVEKRRSCAPILKNANKVFGINLGRFGEFINYRNIFRDTVQFHTHPKDFPLSKADIWAAAKMKMKKSVAVTLSGKYSSIEIKPNQRKSVLKNLYLFDDLYKYIKTLDRSKSEEFFKIVQSGIKSTIKKLVEKTGVAYESNI